MAAFVPIKLNQAALDGIKQSMQGVSLSNVTPAQGVTPQPSQKPLIGPILTPTRPMVDVPAPVSASTPPVTNKPPASFTGTLPGPYPSYDANGKISSIQAGMKVVNGVPQPNVPAPVAASNTTPAPASQGSSFPGQLTSAQIAAEAQARIDKQRAAITSATAAANAARKNVFDYTNQITGDNRTLENGAFNETHDPFTGQTGYAQAQLQRNRSIQDTANNNAYQADITANNQKLSDFETLAPEQQQAAIDELTRIERQYGLDLSAVTGQINGQKTAAQSNADRTYDLAKSAQDYTQSPSNPNNVGQNLTNQLTQLKLNDYPAESQAKAQQTQIDLQTGKINNEVAQFKLNELKDPNSPTNQANAIDLQLKKIDLANAPQEARLKVEEIQKRIDQIGAAPYRTPEAKQKDQLEVQKLQEEVKNLQSPTPKPKTPDSYKTDPNFSQDVAHLKSSPTDAAKLDSNPQPFIDAYGYDGYLALRKAAGLD